MTEQQHKTLRTVLIFLGVVIVVWYLFKIKDAESSSIVIKKDTVIAEAKTIIYPKETRIYYRDTAIDRPDPFTSFEDCQAEYEALWEKQTGLLREYHAIRDYDTIVKDTNYIIKSSIRIQDNRLLSYSLQPTIINTNITTTKYRYSLYGGLYVNQSPVASSYGAVVTLPIKDLQFSVGKNFGDGGWFGSIQTRIFNK
jgi:hypothetical protein